MKSDGPFLTEQILRDLATTNDEALQIVRILGLTSRELVLARDSGEFEEDELQDLQELLFAARALEFADTAVPPYDFNLLVEDAVSRVLIRRLSRRSELELFDGLVKETATRVLQRRLSSGKAPEHLVEPVIFDRSFRDGVSRAVEKEMAMLFAATTRIIREAGMVGSKSPEEFDLVAEHAVDQVLERTRRQERKREGEAGRESERAQDPGTAEIDSRAEGRGPSMNPWRDAQ